MDFDYSVYSIKYHDSFELYCNLVKGDSKHDCEQFLRYDGKQFHFYDYCTGDKEEVPDYTALDDAELFQARLVFDARLVCTIEEMIPIQQELKEHSEKKVEYGYNHRYYFNLEDK